MTRAETSGTPIIAATKSKISPRFTCGALMQIF
jgi:hypothetical protein